MWMAERFQVIICTIAFGMGINKRNVRFIIHDDTPNSFSNYLQAIGRAGRDGRQADAYLFYGQKLMEWYLSQNAQRVYKTQNSEKFDEKEKEKRV